MPLDSSFYNTDFMIRLGPNAFFVYTYLRNIGSMQPHATVSIEVPSLKTLSDSLKMDPELIDSSISRLSMLGLIKSAKDKPGKYIAPLYSFHEISAMDTDTKNNSLLEL